MRKSVLTLRNLTNEKTKQNKSISSVLHWQVFFLQATAPDFPAALLSCQNSRPQLPYSVTDYITVIAIVEISPETHSARSPDLTV